MYEGFVVHQRKGRVLRLFVTSLVFVVIGCFMIHSSSSQDVLWGWFGICFFGLCAIVMSIQIFRSAPLQIDSTGITGYHRGWFRLHVPIGAICAVKVGSTGFAPYVLIEYIDMGRVRKAYFPLFSVTTTTDELTDVLEEFGSHKGGQCVRGI